MNVFHVSHACGNHGQCCILSAREGFYKSERVLQLQNGRKAGSRMRRSAVCVSSPGEGAPVLWETDSNGLANGLS